MEDQGKDTSPKPEESAKDPNPNSEQNPAKPPVSMALIKEVKEIAKKIGADYRDILKSLDEPKEEKPKDR